MFAKVVGTSRVELLTSSVSGKRSTTELSASTCIRSIKKSELIKCQSKGNVSSKIRGYMINR